jgi:hypothetical protein
MSGKGTQPVERSTLIRTKQLLDELDVLMEKMLALPVEEPPADSPERDELMRLPHVSATLTVLEGALDAAPPDKVGAAPLSALASSPRRDDAATLPEPHANFLAAAQQNWQEPQASLSLVAPANEAAQTSAADGIPLDAVPPALLQVHVPPVTVLPLAARTLRAILMQPLLWVNGIFDLCTRFLGPFGRWLRTGQGRNALGYVGVSLILLAVAWVVKDWMSWTQ